MGKKWKRNGKGGDGEVEVEKMWWCGGKGGRCEGERGGKKVDGEGAKRK